MVFAVSPVLPQFVLGGIIAFAIAIITELLVSYCGFNKHAPGSVALAAYAGAFSLTIIICSILASILYCELAQRLGIGKKWVLVSSAVLAAVASHWQYTIQDGIGFLSVMLPVQFIVPLAVGWRFAQRKRKQRYPVTAFFVFAVSPALSLFAVLLLLTLCMTLFIPGVHFGTTALAVLPYAFSLATIVVPSILLSILYCGLAKRLGIGRKWTLVACVAMAMFGALIGWQHLENVTHLQCIGGFGWETDAVVYSFGCHSLMQLLQFLVPLAVGLWFLRRKHSQSQLQLAS